MKKMRQRWIAILCCVAMLVTGLYVSEPRKAEAASSGEMSITSSERGFILKTTNSELGYINVGYSATGVVTGNDNVFTDDFIDNYMIFEGGMTKEDFKDGFEKAYLADSSTLQIRWPDRTKAFEAGWSFSIVEGAPIYHNGGASYATLDKEYTFLFAGAANGNDNVVYITGYESSSFSLPTGLWGNSTTGGDYNINLVGAEGISNSAVKYDTVSEQYCAISDVEYSDYESKGIAIKSILNGAGAKVLQIVWGQLRAGEGDVKLVAGDQIVLYKGLPITYTYNGENYRARLDSTYVYECDGPNYKGDGTVDNTQTFYGLKYDPTNNVYGLPADGVAEWTGLQGTDQIKNYKFVSNDPNLVGSLGDMRAYGRFDNMTDRIAEDYIEITGMTVKQARSLGIILNVLGNEGGTGYLQMTFSQAAVQQLKVGTQIILKKGLPLVYMSTSGALSSATLDDSYVYTIVDNDGTSLKIDTKLKGEFSLKSYSSGITPEGSNYYVQADCTSNAFVDVAGSDRGWGRLEATSMKEYFYLSKHSYESLASAGAWVQYYTQAKLLRLYYPQGSITFNEGEVLIWKKGLPVTYATTSGETKMVTLDKDYGFRYTNGSFVYDSTLTYDSIPQEETFVFTTTSAGSFQDGGVGPYKTNLYYETNIGTATDTNSVDNILDSNGEAGATSEYVDIFGMDADYIGQLGISIKLYPGEPCFQIVWGTDVFDWIEDGMIITFKKGMPVYYATGDVMCLTEDTYYQVANVSQATSSFTLQSYQLPLEVKKFTLPTNDFGTGINAADTGIVVLDEEQNCGLLNDADANEMYLWLGGRNDNYEEMARWVDYLGFSAEQLREYGVGFRLVRVGDTQVLQIIWGTSVARMGMGSRITFKAGMPFSYTVGGKEQKIELAQDYTFEVDNSNTDNTWVYSYVTTENSGTFSLEYGTTQHISHQGDPLEYYHNHTLVDSAMLTDCVGKQQYVTIPTGVLMEYMEFGDIAPENYEALGISAKLILDAVNVMQVVWGTPSKHTIDDGTGKQVATSDLVKEGDKIVFKIGMPVTMTTKDGKTQRYVLDKNYSYTIEKYTLGSNGYRVSGEVEEVENIVSGDVDGDYLLNKNDITLVRKQLVNLIAVSDVAYVDANGKDEVTSADLVHAKKNWDEAEPETYTTLYEDVVIPSGNLPAGNTTTININKNLGKAGYLRFTYQSTADIYGTIYYTYSGKEYSENFYLSKDDVQFEQFLDNYRVNGVIGTSVLVDKTLTKIAFKNLGDEAATFLLNKLEVADREFKNDNMLYTDNGKVKIGVDLNQGGTLTWLQDLVHNPVEYTSSSTLKIATQDKYTSGYNANTDVNLVNIYDLGRQMQQSYYIDVLDDVDGHGTSYVRGSYNDNTNWAYNPVQAGDQFEHQSQIIDYRVIDGKMIYVKVRAMDWSDPDNIKNNSASSEDKSEKGTTTKSYMESWYRLEDDMLFVDNAFVDWSGWKNVGVPYNQELPAFYTAAALNYFVEGNDTATRTIYGNWDKGTHFRKEGSEVSDWYAYVNGNSDTAYGLGIYMPNVTGCTAGRYRYTSKVASFYDSSTNENGNVGSTSNKGAEDAPIFGVGAGNGGKIGNYLQAKNTYQNCYLINTSYIATTIEAVLKEYRTYSYTYVLHANELNEMKSSFAELKAEGTVTNNQLSLW